MMDKSYQPKNIEQRIYDHWEKENYFIPQGNDSPYCIVIPPPNVTGTLHMGHAFQDTIMDALTRYHRMLGHQTLWQPGTDHAGIATQMVVERLVNAEGKSKHDLGRDKFIERVWSWKEESGGKIAKQTRRLGASVDWSRDRFTMDDGMSDAVQKVFIQLYEEGLIYRGKRLVNWDPVLHTALSDLEVLSEDEKGSLWHFRYPLTNNSGYLVVATTRPETMLGDSAVAVNPEDERYKKFIGQEIKLPIVGRCIPIIADDYVDPEFGTGCVKITPAHDFNDYEIGKRHGLTYYNILDENAAMNGEVPEKFRGMDRFVARKEIVKDIKSLNLLEKIEDYTVKIPRGDRSNAVVEPYLTDQWYVKIAPLAEPAIKAVKNGDIKFVPENWSKTYFDWMYKIEDWCISRQLWWGHRIPAWYDEEGHVFVGNSEEEVREKNNLKNVQLRQDDDVLDTWFSSALWPFSTMGWPEKTNELKNFYPGNVLVTGFDIIFFWVARMIMFGLKFMNNVPFREVYIHGLIRDQDGQKMSKSKGNVLDPIDLIDGIGLDSLVEKRTKGMLQGHLAPKIEKSTRKYFPNGIEEYGADALRLTFASLATTGRDIRFDMGRIEGYKNFCNKLWNASKYVLINTESLDEGEVEFSSADHWIQSRLNEAAIEIKHQFKNYRLDLALQSAYDFTWHELCDWYLELSKPILQSSEISIEKKRGTQKTLIEVLEATLRLLHPFMPFITEEIWQNVAPRAKIGSKTIMLRPFPVKATQAYDDILVSEIEWVKQFILGIRQIRGEMNISPGKPIPVILQGANISDIYLKDSHSLLLQKVGRIKSISILDDNDTPPTAATALLGDMRLLVPMKDLIDIDSEIVRLSKQKEKINYDLQQSTKKLKNEKFIQNAPTEIIEQEQDRVKEFLKIDSQLSEQIAKLNELL